MAARHTHNPWHPCAVRRALLPGAQWAQSLVKPELWHSASKMTAALKDLCLVNCAGDAATALMVIHKHLGDIAVG